MERENDVASMVKRLNNLQAYLEKCLTSPTKTCEEAAALLARQGWIPVSERLPKEGVDNSVLVWKEGEELPFIGWIAVGSHTLWDSDTGFAENITHWMPLPPAP